MGFPAFDLSGRVAVVVGGTTGIGYALTQGLAQAGADVVPTARRREEVERAAAAVETLGRRTLRVTSDVTRRDSLEKARDEVLRAFGTIDILINCAGRTKRTPTLALPDEEWNSIIETNLTGTLRGCQVFGAPMVERRAGRIINIASLTSFVGFLEVTAYGVSKTAVVGLTRQLAVEWAPHNVCVNAIAPGVFKTALNAQLLDGTPRGQELLLRTPMKRFGKVEELAGAAVFLASDAAGFITGQTLAVDGGFLASGVNQ